MSKSLLSGLALAALAGCAAGVTTVSQLPDTVVLRIGHEVRLTSPAMRLRLEAVVQDSRCPIDAVCIQPGSATFRFTVIRPGVPDAELLLETGQVDATTGVQLRITEVTPAPHSSKPIDPGDYRVTLEIAPFIAPG